MTRELYINGMWVDLPNDNVLAMTYQVNQLNSLKTLNGIISNKITLPPTENNLRVLGFIGDMNIDYSKTVRKLALCKYVQNGIEIIPQGTVQYGTRTKKGIDITVSAGNIDFFDVIGGNSNKSDITTGGNISDLDLSAYDHNFDFFYIPPSRLNRSGYIYPIINYGDLTNSSTGVQAENMRPATFVKTIIDEIVKQAGFTLINELETHPLAVDMYNAMIIPFSLDNFKHGQRYITRYAGYALSVKKNANSALDCNSDHNPGIYVTIPFDTVLNDPSGSFAANVYTAQSSFIADVTVTVPAMTVNGLVNNSVGRTVTLHLVRNRASVETDIATIVVKLTTPNGSAAPQTFTNLLMTAAAHHIQTGDKFFVRTDVYLHQNVTVTLFAPYTFTLTAVIADVAFGESVELEATLPDIGQTDFIKAIANLFAGIVQTDSLTKTVHIVPFVKIPENIPIAVDWSDRVVNVKDETGDVYIGSYAQANLASYDNDEAVDQIATVKNYASAFLNIADENLLPTGELFKLPFSASNDDTVISGLSAIDITKIPVGETEFSIGTKPRICLLDFQNVKMNYIRGAFTQTETTSIPLTYFASKFLPDLTLTKILARYYPDVTKILNDQRKKTVPLLLTEYDINVFDFFTPVYIERYACYFYVAVITNYVGGRPTNVQLIKIY